MRLALPFALALAACSSTPQGQICERLDECGISEACERAPVEGFDVSCLVSVYAATSCKTLSTCLDPPKAQASPLLCLSWQESLFACAAVTP